MSVPLGLSIVSNVVLAMMLVSQLPVPTPLVDHSREVCSGNGMRFQGADACECFDCFSGVTCATRVPEDKCIVGAGSGTPYIFEDYWVNHPEARTTVLPSYHIGYGSELPQLERVIRALHKMVGNAEVDGRHIVIGVGSGELIPAALYALSPEAEVNASLPDAATASVWARTPFYSGYRTPARFFDSRRFTWVSDGQNATSQPPQATAESPLIELVTSPNNPDGHIRTKSVQGEHVRTLMDHAYLWPHFTAIGQPVAYSNSTLAIFTLSKMTGHASTRIGWAITPDLRVADRLREYIQVSGSSPRENQLRAVAALEHVVAHNGEIFAYARRLMVRRWERLEGIFAGQTLYQLAPRDPAAYDSFSGTEGYAASPAYAWITLTNSTQHQGDAMVAMASVGIKGRGGPKFGADKCHVRLELLMREETFELLAVKLERLLHPA